MINCPFKGRGRDALPCEATPELRRASQCPDCITLYLKQKARALVLTEASASSQEVRA